MEQNYSPQLVLETELGTTAESEPVDWIWDGFVARRCLTLLTSQWKSGKTTLVSMLLARRRVRLGDAGDTLVANAPGSPAELLAGHAVQPGKTLIITEEDRGLWAERVRHYGFGGQTLYFPQPFRAIPGPDEWQALIEQVVKLQDEHGIDLLVVDPLAHFLRCEDNKAKVLEAIMPLRELTRRGMAVLVLHHPSKSHTQPVGRLARGSGSLLGHVDINIEMRIPPGDPFTRRRRFVAISRLRRTPVRLLLEMNADATDYLAVLDPVADDFTAHWHVLNMIFEDAPQRLTRRDILLEWPEDFEKPNPSTLHRWLIKAEERQLILHEGTGRKKDPFRYWLPAAEARWKESLFYEVVNGPKVRFTPLHWQEGGDSTDFDDRPAAREPETEQERELNRVMKRQLAREMREEAECDAD